MTPFPTPWSVGVHTFSDGGTDAHGNPIVTYTPPLSEPGTPVPVYGWFVPSSTEPVLAGHDRVIVDVQLLVPPGFPAGPRDVVDVPGGPAGQFTVVGYPEDYTHGPFGWAPGAVVNLRKVDG